MKSADTYILLAIFALIGAWLYVRHRNKLLKEMDIEEKYMSNPEDIKAVLSKKLRRPILWIFIDYKYNSMKWASFYSRSNTNMNVPFVDMTVESIINHCSESFNICLINDKSFAKLLPEWKTDISFVGEPLQDKIRYYGMISLLHKYGGLLVPSSFLCLKDLEPLYRISSQTQKPIVFQDKNRKINTRFIGAEADDKILTEYKSYLERNLSRDYTDESNFLGDDSKWLMRRVREDTVKCVHGEVIGVITREGEPIDVQNIVSINTILLEPKENLYGILMPLSELLKRKEYKWFCYLSEGEVLTSKTCVAKYFQQAINL
jgi:hypothetical protein